MNRDALEDSFCQWARRTATPLANSAGVEDQTDLQPLASLVGGARIVGIGESQHFCGAFSRFRGRAFRFLVEKMGFTTFAFECDSITGRIAHDYVACRHDNLDASMLGFQNAFGLWQETRDTLQWMRSWNQKNSAARQLTFYGIDGSEFWGSTAGAVRSVVTYLDQAEPDLAKTVQITLMPLAAESDLRSLASCNEEALEQLIIGIGSLQHQFTTRQLEWISRTGYQSFDWARRAIITAAQVASILLESKRDPANASKIWWYSREAGMASLIRWILDREGPDARLVVGAHNIHLQRDFAHESNFDQATLVQYLATELAPLSMVMISGTNNGCLRSGDLAVPHSFQAVLARVGIPEFLLDLRRAKEQPELFDWLMQSMPDRTNTMYQPMRPAIAWDGVFFSETITLDKMNLPLELHRALVSINPIVCNGLEGNYIIDGVVGQHVELRIAIELAGMFSYGEHSDGELFPMHRSRLYAVSSDSFVWKEWPLTLEFIRDKANIAQMIVIRFPDCNQEYRGRRADS